MITKKSNSTKQSFLSKIYDSNHKWKSDLWMLKWIALLFIVIDFHLINITPISRIDVILTEFSYFLYILLFTIFFRNRLSFRVQFFSLVFDLLFFSFFQYLSLSMFAADSRIYVLFLLPVIYCSYWFKLIFALFFTTVISSIYFLLNYFILLANQEKFIISSKIMGTLGPVIAMYFITTFLVIFFKRIILRYLVDFDQEVAKRTEKLEQEKEYTWSLLKDKIDGFIAIDEKGDVTGINKVACELFGYDETDICTKNVKDIYAPDESARMMRALKGSTDGTIEHFKTYVINKKEKEKIPIQVSAALLYDRSLDLHEELANNKLFPSLGYFRDLRAEEIFDQIGKEITSMKNEDELLTEIAGSISRILKAETCSILIHNGTRNRLEVRSCFGMPSRLKNTIKFEKYNELEGLTGYVFFKESTLNIKHIDIFKKRILTANNPSINIDVKWNYVKNFAEHSKYKDFQHFLATPLRAQGEVYGVIKVLNKYINDKKLDKRGFQDKDQRLLERISNQISVLVEKVKNKERFDAISKIGMELNEKLDLPLEDFLGLVASEAVNGIRFTACFIYVEEENKLIIRASKGFFGDYLGNEAYSLEIGEGISGTVAQTGIHRTISGISKDESEFKDIDILKKEKMESILSVPINYENKAFGVINCCTRRTHIFTPEEIQIIKTCAVYTAVAIRNRKRIQELLALNEIGSELVKPFQLENLFDQILQKAKEISGADRLCIKRYYERTGEIKTIRSLNCEWHSQMKNHVGKLGEDFASKTIRKGEPIIIRNYNIKLENLEKVPKTELFADTKSIIKIPIIIYGKVFGVLNLDSKRKNSFNENDLLVLKTFSNKAATAIRNADFFNKLQDVKQTFPRISELSSDIDEVLEKIVNTSAEVLETDVLVLYRYDEKTKKIVLPPIYTGDIKFKEYIDHEATSAITPLSIINNGKSHYANNSREDLIMVSKEKTLPGGIPEHFVFREDIVSSAGIILRVGNEIVGVMFINYRTSHDFNDDERQIIEIYASYIAIAIQNVLHFSEKKIANTMNTVGKIASNFAHKMKNDIATIKLYADALTDEVKPGDSQYRPLSEIMGKITKITADIDHIEKASKLNVKRKKNIDIEELINELEVELLPDLGIRKVEFEIDMPPDIPKIEIDPLQVKMVLINLAQNSFDAMPDGGKISLSISKSDEALLLKWTDSGSGILPENASRIFDALWTGKKKGYGLGLYHAKTIIEEHHGSISVDSEYRKGARFLIKIPYRQESYEVKGE